MHNALVVSCLIVLSGIFSSGLCISHSHDEIKGSSKLISAADSVAFEPACSSSQTCMQHPSESLADGNPLKLIIDGTEAALSHVDQAKTLAKTLSTQQGNGLEVAAVLDCLELLDDAMDQLNRVIFQLSSLDLIAPWRQLTNVKMQISTALSYQTACADGFYNESGRITNQMLKKQIDVSTFVTNALYFVDLVLKLRRFLPPTHARKLLSEQNTNDGFPAWLSVAKRKLLQAPSLTAFGFDVTVAKDGTGQYYKIQDAVDDVPDDYEGRYVIYIKEGVYHETVTVSKKLENLTFFGDGVDKTIITGNRNVASGRYTTFRSATVAISGQGFMARDITFRNTAGPRGHQAVALRVGADCCVFESCNFEGYQDTLYALSSRQFFRNCTISGTVDFIFGNAAAVFQNCQLLARQPLQGQKNTYTAQGRKVDVDPTGFSFDNCTVTSAEELTTSNYSVSTFLGRPWKAYSRAVFINSYLDSVIDPAGWLAWNESNPFEDTVYYGEYQNIGAGSDTSARVDWPGIHPEMSFEEAVSFNAENFISGTTWLPEAEVIF